MTIAHSHRLALSGLDGSNVLGFLAALGATRILSQTAPAEEIKLSWDRESAWRPVISSVSEWTSESLVEKLQQGLVSEGRRLALNLDDNLKVSPDKFRKYSVDAQNNAQVTGDRQWSDFVVAFGCDQIFEEDIIGDTALRTMSGAGHQHFLKSMRDLCENTTATQLHHALFEPWSYLDPAPSMRWDPNDDRRYALRWKEPSGDPSKTVRGANRLAIEALPFFPTAPVKGSLQTTGFKGKGMRGTYFIWPIWTPSISADVIKSVLSLGELQAQELDRRKLASRGIVEVFQSQRLTIGKFRNFTPSSPV